MATMKAAVMYGPNDIRYEDTEKPVCPQDGLILKIMAVGLCGSDIRNLTSDSRKGNYPFIYGHEIVGVVDEVGPETTKYKVGDRLYLFPGTYCMECDNCISGHSENCENEHVAKLAGTGGFAQYIAVGGEKIKYGGIYRIPEGIKYEAASLGEPLTSVYACEDNIGVGYNDVVVIIGAGPIGCFMTKLAKLRGAKTVIMIDINQMRLDQVKQFGADYIINSKDQDPVEAVKEWTDGRGVDAVILAVGVTAANDQALEMIKRLHGRILMFAAGYPAPELHVDSNLIHYRKMELIGTFSADKCDFERAAELMREKKIDLSKLVEAKYKLDDVEQAFEAAIVPGAYRVSVVFD